MDRALEIPFFERKIYARGGANLANNAVWTHVLPTEGGQIVTLERIYVGTRLNFPLAGHLHYELWQGPDWIWTRVDYAGVNLNEELNVTFEGGETLTFTITNHLGGVCVVQPLLVYRFERRGARGRTHGGDKLDGWGHRVP